ncbi:MAG: nuclear transport factor 2 family protein [Myxococcales bacterium]|nr:nuclear transport factor 2 family protein [Myxococcales bacterium]
MLKRPFVALLHTALAAVLLSAAPGCGKPPAPAPKPPASPSQPAAEQDAKAAIAAMLDDWHLAASKADEARYFGHFAKGAHFIGTDATERWDVAAFRAYAHPHFSKGKGWTYGASSRFVTIADGAKVAWFHEQLVSAKYGAVRGSGVASQTPNGWKISQYVMSFPIPNAKAKAVLKLVNAGDTGESGSP